MNLSTIGQTIWNHPTRTLAAPGGGIVDSRLEEIARAIWTRSVRQLTFIQVVGTFGMPAEYLLAVDLQQPMSVDHTLYIGSIDALPIDHTLLILNNVQTPVFWLGLVVATPVSQRCICTVEWVGIDGEWVLDERGVHWSLDDRDTTWNMLGRGVDWGLDSRDTEWSLSNRSTTWSF